MPIELIQFPKSQAEGDEGTPPATVNQTWAAAAMGLATVLGILGLLAPLWGPVLEEVLARQAEAQADPDKRDSLYGLAWYARVSGVWLPWLALANALSYLGFAFAIVRIDQVVRDDFRSGLAHLDGGLLDCLACTLCFAGGGPAGFFALAAYSQFRFAYPYRYSRSAVAISGTMVSAFVVWFTLGLVGHVTAERPDYEAQIPTWPYWTGTEPSPWNQEASDGAR